MGTLSGCRGGLRHTGTMTGAMMVPPIFRRLALPMLATLMMMVLQLAAVPEAVAQRRTITLTAKQLTDQAATRFPQRRCLLGLACITLADPVIRLKDGDPRLFVTARATPDMGAQPLATGLMEVAGKPRYDPARGAFFVDAPEVLRLDFPELPAAYLGSAAELSRGLLVDYLRQTPVWVLDEHDAQQALAKLVLRQIEVKGGTLRIVIGDDE
jgi:hypothetical protein